VLSREEVTPGGDQLSAFTDGKLIAAFIVETDAKESSAGGYSIVKYGVHTKHLPS